MASTHLLEFYGRECVHCRRMHPLVKRLESELHIALTRYEVWHNEGNARLMREYDKGVCGGVPFFYNTRTGMSLCGEISYSVLKGWALGEGGNLEGL